MILLFVMNLVLEKAILLQMSSSMKICSSNYPLIGIVSPFIYLAKSDSRIGLLSEKSVFVNLVVSKKD